MEEKNKELDIKESGNDWEKFAKEAGLSEFKSIEDFAKSYKELAKKSGESEKSKIQTEESFTELLRAARKEVATSQASTNAQAVKEYLSDPVVKQNVERAANAEGAVDELQKQINSGEVSLREIKLWSKLGEDAVEGSANAGEPAANSNAGLVQKEKELMNIVRNQAHIWNDERHPQHKEVKSRMQQLEKELVG